ncbi:MAG: hypothetical protein Q9160_009261 [Pyrenula sp. 1 TL-2023]
MLIGLVSGDFLAVSRLIYRIAGELKRIPESATDYQDLLVELEALDRALKQLFSIEPAEHEAKRLDAVRALAVTCQGPLEAFLEKIEKFEQSIGTWNVKQNGVRGLHRRLQWSMKYKDDVALLRSRLAPKISTITILLLTATTKSLAKADTDRHDIAKEVAHKLFGQNTLLRRLEGATTAISSAQSRIEKSQILLMPELEAQGQNVQVLECKTDELLNQGDDLERHLRNQDSVLAGLHGSGLATNNQIRASHSVLLATQEDVNDIKATTSSLLGRALDILTIVATGISKVNDIAERMRQLVSLTTDFTTEMRDAVSGLFHEFLEMQRRFAQIERFLPRQIDLPVVRFRDAFNDMRSLPYDLSRNWQTFQGLVTVVFTNRQGLNRVNRGLYFITHARIGQRIKPEFWSKAIEPNDELSMTMILDDVEGEEGICPWPLCHAITKDIEVTNGGKFCPDCHRFAIVSTDRGMHSSGHQNAQIDNASPIDKAAESSSQTRHFLPKLSENDASLPENPPIAAPEVETPIAEDIELYHSIEVARASQKIAESSYGQVDEQDDDIAPNVLPVSDASIEETLRDYTKVKPTAWSYGLPPKGYKPIDYSISPFDSDRGYYTPRSYAASKKPSTRNSTNTRQATPAYVYYDPNKHEPFEYSPSYHTPREHSVQSANGKSAAYFYVDDYQYQGDSSKYMYRTPRRSPKKPSTSKKPLTRYVPKKASEEDAMKANIPAGYSTKNWDPTEAPIIVLGSVFDANSLGKWIYDWTVYLHGGSAPLVDVAGDLWLLLIKLSGKLKRSEEILPRIRSRDSQDMVEDFVESGMRLWAKLRDLIKKCELFMWKALKGQTSRRPRKPWMSADVYATQSDDKLRGKWGRDEEPDRNKDQPAVEKRPQTTISEDSREMIQPVLQETEHAATQESHQQDLQEAQKHATQEATTKGVAGPNKQETQEAKPKVTSGAKSRDRNAGAEFVDSIFGRDRYLELTEKLMSSMRLWNMRFDANCEEILRKPSA